MWEIVGEVFGGIFELLLEALINLLAFGAPSKRRSSWGGVCAASVGKTVRNRPRDKYVC